MAFPVEDIPDSARLFRPVAPAHWDHNLDEPNPLMAFKFDPDLSTNWNKYAPTAEHAIGNRNPERRAGYGAVSFPVKELREKSYIVRHTPNLMPKAPDDQSHASVIHGHTKNKMHVLTLMRLYDFEKRPTLASTVDDPSVA